MPIFFANALNLRLAWSAALPSITFYAASKSEVRMNYLDSAQGSSLLV